MDTLAQRLDGERLLAERQRALSELIDLAIGPLKGFLHSRQVPSDRWDDLIADTWLVVIDKIHRGAYCAARGDPISYVVGIAANVLRRANTNDALLSLDDRDPVDPTQALTATEAALTIAEAASKLTDAEDQAVLKAILAERTISEMAVEFGVSYKTAWRRYHRCLDHCRAALHA